MDWKNKKDGETVNEGVPLRMESPFSFLSTVSRDRIDVIHAICRSNLPNATKDTMIRNALEDSKYALEKYDEWALQAAIDNIPVIFLRMMPPDDFLIMKSHLESQQFQEAIDRAPDELKEELYKWIQEVLSKRGTDFVFPSAKILLEKFMTSKPTENRSDDEHVPRRPRVTECEPTYATVASGNGRHVTKEHGYTMVYKRIDSMAKSSSRYAPIHQSKGDNEQKQTTLNGGKQMSVKKRSSSADVPREMTLNILLLGETGVGKTTFINSLANYLKFASLGEALDQGPTILVDTAFTTTNRKNKMISVSAVANSGHRNLKHNEKLGGKGISSTQNPVDHLFHWTENGVTKTVRIIDTPGINDTRGCEQDVKNFDKILAHISNIGELHAICILLKPNESKFTVGFRYCIDNLLVKLHKNATRNILFCFTNTRSTLYRPGDTLSTLKEHLKNLERETGVLIKADRNNIFCFDNDCFRYLCTIKQLPLAQKESSQMTFSEGWDHNVKEVLKMLIKVQGLKAHVVEDTMSINHARTIVTALARPLAEIARNHIVNKQLIQDRIDEIKRMERAGQSLDECMFREQVVMIPVKLENPRTVCTSSSCVEYIKINEHEMQTIPRQICHDSCHLLSVPEQSVNNSGLKECAAFREGICTTCGCSWRSHMHLSYEFHHGKERVMDENAWMRRQNCTNNKKAAETLIQEHKEQCEALEREQEHIRECAAEFSAFLCVNSMKQTSDPFADYLRYLYQDEVNKSAHGGSSAMLGAVFIMMEDYDKGLKYIMDEIQEGRRNAVSTAQLYKMIDNLGKMKICGKQISHLKENLLSMSFEGVWEDKTSDDIKLRNALGATDLGSRNGSDFK